MDIEIMSSTDEYQALQAEQGVARQAHITEKLALWLQGVPPPALPDGVEEKRVGAGGVALFCDVNMEAASVQRVLSYCKLDSPEAPIAAALDDAALVDAAVL